jgi:hypothetical protein
VKLLGTVSDRLDSIGKRCDALEKRGDVLAAQHEDPEPLAADDARQRDDAYRTRTAAERADNAVCDWRNEDKFADFQARCDAVASLFGQKAARPMQGESLGNFKRRSVRPWQSLSPTYASADLNVLQVADGIAFNAAIDDVLKCARAEGQRPTRVPLGYLAERVETKGGHTITRFYDRPQSWMDQFMPRGARVKRMHRLDSEGNIAGVAYSRDRASTPVIDGCSLRGAARMMLMLGL